ncbi:apolipoprotein N-acyltransferase [Aliiroseovarius sp. KMU-50]|uniref:Apolipoprotein N-acyltransferase n=1 Tax=Aliiroseovarius salicola TaxID=3009082 RepID=A0ABT4W647_9RHOB|nr:apolipoprotein N-acyltransferase [Aliiroseovarius sp. KMU-50]MDA5095515.1 apolipoprotein N-acyltransferase [Aliiroseovarius sp. KMU-50]
MRGILPVLLGAVAALGQAPIGWWWATLLGMAVGLWWILQAEQVRPAFWRGWLLGVGYFAVSLNWLIEPFLVDAARHAWMAPFALLGLAGGLALFWGAAAGLAHRIGLAKTRWLALAVLLTGSELIRGYIFTGFPWAGLGHVWIDTPIAQLAAWIGASGLGAFTLLAAALLAQVAASKRIARFGYAVPLIGCVAGANLMGGFLERAEQPADQDITVRLIQPNAPQHQKWDPRFAAGFVQRQLELTKQPASSKPDLILWPETSVPYRLRDTGGLAEMMSEAGQGVPILFGAQRDDGLRFFNSLAMTTPNGTVTPIYDKHHLVPFGEYIPFGDVLADYGITAFAAQLGHGYSAGSGAQVLDLGALGKVLPLICYEAVFPQDVRAAPERPDWILHATNDAWFGNFSGPQQHLAQARIRAIEFGLPVIRVANTGVSAVIDPRGEIRDQLPLNTHGVLDVKIPGSRGATPYSRQGDLPLTLIVITALGVLAAGSRSKSN